MTKPPFHTVRSLYWAKPCRPPPGREHEPRRKGTKAQGLAYERAIAQALAPQVSKLRRGQWFEFCDSGVVRHCQVDFVFPLADEAVILEAKLTDTDRAYGQLRGLYFPVLALALGVPVRGVVVARHLRSDSGRPFGSIREALSAPGIPLVHWIGTGPLW